MGRNKKRNVFVSGTAAPIEEGFEPASLHIGGITICPPRNSSQRGGRKPAPRASSAATRGQQSNAHHGQQGGCGSDDSSGSSSDSSSEWSTDQEADTADYLENLGLHASTSESDDDDDVDEESICIINQTLGSSSHPDSPTAPGGGASTSARASGGGRDRRPAAGQASAANLSQKALEKMAVEEEVVQVQVDSDGNAVEEVRHWPGCQAQQQRAAALPQVQAFIAQELQRQRMGSAAVPSPSGNARQGGGPRWSGMPIAFMHTDSDGSGPGRPSFPNLAEAMGAPGVGLSGGGGGGGGVSGDVALGGGSTSSASLRQPMRFVSAGIMADSGGDRDGKEEPRVQVIGGSRQAGGKEEGVESREEPMSSAREGGGEGEGEGKNGEALVVQKIAVQQQQQQHQHQQKQQEQQACIVALAQQMVDLSQAVLRGAQQVQQQQQQQQQLSNTHQILHMQRQMRSAVTQLQQICQLQHQQQPQQQQKQQQQQQPAQQQESAQRASPVMGPPAEAAPLQQTAACAALLAGMGVGAGAAPTPGAEEGTAQPRRSDDAAPGTDGDSPMQVEVAPGCGGIGRHRAEGSSRETNCSGVPFDRVCGSGQMQESRKRLEPGRLASEGGVQGVGVQWGDPDAGDAEDLVKEMERSLLEGWMAGEDGGMGSGSETDESDSTSGEGEGAEEEEEEEGDLGRRGVGASTGAEGGVGRSAEEDEEEEGEEEMQHRGLGFVSSADDHTYTRSNFSLGLEGPHGGLGFKGSSGVGVGPLPSSTASPNLGQGLNQSVEPLIPNAPTESAPAVLPSKKERRAAQRAQQASVNTTNRANLNNPNNPNFQGSRAETFRGMRPKDWANINNPNHRSYQGLTRGQQVRQYQDAMLFGGIMPTSSQSVARGGPNQTKKQAKAASRKEAKDARRLLQRGGQSPQQMQQDREFSGASGRGGIGRAVESPAVAPAQLHYQFASFERHTSGIGSRLMESMGWSRGTGLGRVEQGRSEPLLPQRRPNKLGLGA
ncbi:hypothetical protein DUNSADRAFT_15697 [Dunaliella salina]|uniref:G-patch domain-containing protein n=1 Tax=Dunaliella salina TaxID=3046 RepID=A0ABQ7G4W3_DUNSA|nr:hypothetical protein DUNSADRAFT_15697 [Dunaliella salina]|eukprot:KAF5829647.1 hypothetical protein DUNSADRAFT_15697 [Dunaliella salina]